MGLGDIKIGACLGEVVDEVGCNTDLGTDVGELGKGSPEKGVLLAERLVDVAGGASGHLGLVSHVGVGDFGNGSEVEDDSEDGDESSDTKVDPLHGLEGATISTDVLEDNLSSEDRSDDRSNSLDGLGQFQTELRPLGRTAHSNVWVGRDFESRQTRSSKEHGTTEAAEASLHSARPEHERTNAVDRKTEDEGVAVTELAEEPSRVCEGTDEVSTEVGCLQTRGFTLGDVQGDLEAGVENIEKTVSETPHEEPLNMLACSCFARWKRCVSYRVVTSATGTMDWRVVSCEAPVTTRLSTLLRRVCSSTTSTTDGRRPCCSWTSSIVGSCEPFMPKSFTMVAIGPIGQRMYTIGWIKKRLASGSKLERKSWRTVELMIL